jgi:beta-aspartyl-peptidase (threonine type)
MKDFTIAIHGGAGDDSQQIREKKDQYEAGLKAAVMKGFNILKQGGSATEAVVAAVMSLEDNPLFNAGRGSALNDNGQVEMDASIMNGKTLNSGAVAIVQNVKNPVLLAQKIMEQTAHVFMGGPGALDCATRLGLDIKPLSYFITTEQYSEYLKKNTEETFQEKLSKKMPGTVGAVALDAQGNLAAATSSGGLSNCLHGRISDSCMIGAGCYANNKTCAVSGTGDGEFLIRAMLAHDISSLVEYTKISVKDACDHVIHVKNKNVKGDLGVIGLDTKGNLGFAFNSERMHRAWIGKSKELSIHIY